MTCYICYEKCNELNNLSCSHTNSFHQECLNIWKGNYCPLCRKNSFNLKDYLLTLSNDPIITNTISPLNEEDLINIGNFNGESFMFDNNEIIRNIDEKINSYEPNAGHSGFSYAFVMRWIQRNVKEYNQMI